MMRTWSGFSFSWAGLCCTNNAEKKASATFVFFKIAPIGWRTNDTGRHRALLSLRPHGRVRHASPAGPDAGKPDAPQPPPPQPLPAAQPKPFNPAAPPPTALPPPPAPTPPA